MRRLNKFLILILLIALGLRLWGINYGLPFIFHPDEPTVVRSALGVRFYLNPKHFDWPHLYIYANYFLYMIFAKVRALIGSNLNIPYLWDDNVIFYLITRIFTAVLGALTTLPVYLSAKKLFSSKRVGLLAAFAIAVFPFHVLHSHYSLTDVPMVFLLSWVMYFSAGILESSGILNYVFAGLFTGLSASTKYNGGLGVLAVAVAHFLRIKKRVLKDWWKALIAGAVSILGFLLGTPFALLDYKTFTRTDGPAGALWQFTNVGKVPLRTQFVQFFTNLVTKIADDLGYIPLVLYFVGLGLFIMEIIRKKKVSPQLLFLFISSLSFLFYISGFEKTRSHYYMIAYPFVAVVCGFVINWLLTVLEAKVLKYLVVGVVFLMPVLFAVNISSQFAQKDTRNILYEWLENNVVENWVFGYNNNELDPVIEPFRETMDVTKNIEEIDYLNSTGILVLSGEDNMPPQGAVKTLEIVPMSNRGPRISVYKF